MYTHIIWPKKHHAKTGNTKNRYKKTNIGPVSKILKAKVEIFLFYLNKQILYLIRSIN